MVKGAVFPTGKQIDAAAEASLRARRARHEPMLYEQEGWMVLEHSDGRIERLAKAGEFKADQILARIDEIKGERDRVHA